MDAQHEQINFVIGRHGRIGTQEFGGGDCPVFPPPMAIRRRRIPAGSRYALPGVIYSSLVFIFILVSFSITNWFYAAVESRIQMKNALKETGNDINGGVTVISHSDDPETLEFLKFLVQFYEKNTTTEKVEELTSSCQSGKNCNCVDIKYL